MGGDREGDWVEGVGHLQGPKLPLGLAPLGLEECFLPGHGDFWRGVGLGGASREPFLAD